MSIPITLAFFLGLLIACVAYAIGFKQGDEAGWRKRSEVHNERSKFLGPVEDHPVPQSKTKTGNGEQNSNQAASGFGGL